ncbi:hypothetical protein PVAP13_7KG077927 [Panicum virgatum]|uniref:Uncharacterized protein n=1 Tax=Panicum virgatum TaxID=38727 RepID=A0A8T0Q6Y4_PANVG|nr:hypothetical protein PVAP13_7KG077927 [Panicum virgatum]
MDSRGGRSRSNGTNESYLLGCLEAGEGCGSRGLVRPAPSPAVPRPVRSTPRLGVRELQRGLSSGRSVLARGRGGTTPVSRSRRSSIGQRSGRRIRRCRGRSTQYRGRRRRRRRGSGLQARRRCGGIRADAPSTEVREGGADMDLACKHGTGVEAAGACKLGGRGWQRRARGDKRERGGRWDTDVDADVRED